MEIVNCKKMYTKLTTNTTFSFFSNKFILFIYFWLRWVFVAARGLSLVAVSGVYPLL